MDFFDRQDRARAATTKLVVLLALATGGLLLLANLLPLWLAAWWGVIWHTGHPIWLHVVVTSGTLAIVIGGIWLKTRELRLGGPALAVLLGGREVMPETNNADERRLRNVVEEMAIAAGIPVPAVFVLPNQGINAFAAGHRLDDTAIAVTAGSLGHLSRDELQALVAHESSHLLNGDARINLRLMAMAHGLLALMHAGQLISRLSVGERLDELDRRRAKGAFPFLVVGIALILLGGLGWLMSNLVRAGISRQREHLADAAAVQFTRNPQAIVSLLRRTLHPAVGSRIHHPEAELASHLFFSKPTTGWFSTHPPLAERIRLLDPTWDGSPLAPGAPPPPPSPTAPSTATSRMPLGIIPSQVDFAGQLLADMPEALTAAAGESYTARALVLAMLSTLPGSLPRIHATDAALAGLCRQLLTTWNTTRQSVVRLPLLHLAIPALRRLSPLQTADLLKLMHELAANGAPSDRLLARLVQAYLAPVRATTAFHDWRPLQGDALTVLATLAHASHDPSGAFRAGWRQLLLAGSEPALPDDPGIDALGAALDRLVRSTTAIRRRLVDGAAHALSADGQVSANEAELLRLICEALGQPLPLFRSK